MRYLLLICCCIAMALPANAKSKTKLVLTIPTENEFVWDSFTVYNMDTVYRFAITHGGNTVIRGIEKGLYKLTLESRFGHTIIRPLNMKQTSKLFVDTRKVYSNYTDTTLITDAMKQNDTLQIYYAYGVGRSGYFKLVKTPYWFKIVIKNEINQWIEVRVTDEEMVELKNIFKGPNYLSSLGYYDCCLHNKLLRGQCGACMYGFLLRKRVVR